MMNNATKLCRKCSIEKPLCNFSLVKNKKYYDSYCKQCKIILFDKWKSNNPEKLRIYQGKGQAKGYRKNGGKQFCDFLNKNIYPSNQDPIDLKKDFYSLDFSGGY